MAASPALGRSSPASALRLRPKITSPSSSAAERSSVPQTRRGEEGEVARLRPSKYSLSKVNPKVSQKIRRLFFETNPHWHMCHGQLTPI